MYAGRIQIQNVASFARREKKERGGKADNGRSKHRGKVPSSPVVPTMSLPLTLATMSEGNFFSFSGGSSSLFPPATMGSNSNRPAMTEISNLLKNTLIKNPSVVKAAPKTAQEDQENVGVAPKIGKPGLPVASLKKEQGLQVQQQVQIQQSDKSIALCAQKRKAPAAECLPPSIARLFEPKNPVIKLYPDRKLKDSTIPKNPAIKFYPDRKLKDSTIPKNPVIKFYPDRKLKDSTILKNPAIKFYPDRKLKDSTIPKNPVIKFYPDRKLKDSTIPANVLSERKTPLFDFPEYTSEIIKYWLSYEKRSCPRRSYMAKQPEISHRMRSILIDWMVEVGMEYNMHSETIFLAVSCVDRFLSKMSVAKNKLQLIGTSALFSCSKFEEIQPPDIGDFVYITDETYTKEQILHMEVIMLRVLSFDLLAPTAHDFVRSFCSILHLNSETTSLAMYLAELGLMDGERYLQYLPSILATSAIALSRYTFQGVFWDDKIRLLSTHVLKDVQHCSQHLFNSFYDAPTMTQTAIYEKYKAVRFCSISQTILPSRLPWVF